MNAYKEPVSIYVENLDLSRFGGSEYEQGLRDIFHIKYRDKPIGVIVAVGAGALDYVSRWRSELWPGVPVVFTFVDEAVHKTLDLPADITGKTTRVSLHDMVAAARSRTRAPAGCAAWRSSGNPAGLQAPGKRTSRHRSRGRCPGLDLNQTVADVFKFVAVQASDAGIELKTDLSASPLFVRGDPIQLQQVVLNLVINSIDAIRDSDSRLRRITGRTTRLGDAKAMISIADTGPGIPANSLNRVLEPFYSTKDRGMGMGLSIARTIIESHGGSIQVGNRDDRGAVFRIELPLLEPQRS